MKAMRAKEKEIATKALAKEKGVVANAIENIGDLGSINVPNA